MQIARPCSLLLLGASLAAQSRMPPQALPMVPPPVPHPAYAAQPVMNAPSPTPAPPSPGSTAGPAGPSLQPDAPSPAEKAAQEFRDKQVKGRELHQKVDAVLKGVPWFEKLTDASARAASEGKPIFWIQMLGDFDGFA